MEAATPRIPGVELLELLGHGAHGAVWRARRGNELCAVKIALRAEVAWERVYQRFRAEGIALARARHPALPKIMEVGRAEGVPYLVMALVEGRTLAEYLQHGPLDEKKVIALARELGEALDAVHGSGLVHRDLKPRNIILEHDTDRVRLVDFGFATTLSRSEPPNAAGTRAYSAPEQLSGLVNPDGRADLYALGCVLRECLLGTRDFGEDVQPAFARFLPAGAGLRYTLRKLHASRPSDRYPSARRFLSDLARLEEIEEALLRAEEPEELAGSPEESAAELCPLVGRTRELHRMRDCLEESRKGRARVVLLHGEAGVGKSRLLRAFLSQHDNDGTFVLGTKCRTGDPRPYSALRSMLSDHLERIAQAPKSQRDLEEGAIRDAAVGPLAGIATVLWPELAPILGVEPTTSPITELHNAFAEAIGEFLTRLLRLREPTVLWIDDLQWLDPPSQQVLTRVLHHTTSSSVLVVATARAEENVDVARFVQSIRSDRLEEISMQPLGEREIRQLAQAYLGVDTVDPALIRRMLLLSDGTPMSVLEIVGVFLDEALLLPHWGTWVLDDEGAETIRLPKGSRDLLRRRLERLPRATTRLLQVAAVMGSRFQDAVLADACGLDPVELGFVLHEARQLDLVAPSGSAEHRFAHDSIREGLVDALDSTERAQMHQRIAEAIDSRASTDSSLIYSLAYHYARGDGGKDAAHRVFETNLSAGRLAFEAFDNQRAISFLDSAQGAAAQARVVPDFEFHRLRGETLLRVGALRSSLTAFESGLRLASTDIERGECLARIAWIHHTESEEQRAYEALDAAFSALGEKLPDETPRSIGRSVFDILGSRLKGLQRNDHVVSHAERARLEILCRLHYQAARLSVETGKPIRLMQSVFASLEAAQRLGPSPALARSYAMGGFVMAALGRTQTASDYLERGKRMAMAIGDPTVFTYCLQLHSVTEVWAGRTDEGIRLGGECLDQYAHWQELGEYCTLALGQYVVETMRGRPIEAWSWIERVLEKVSRHVDAPAVFNLVELAVTGGLTAMGRELEASAVFDALRFVKRAPASRSGYFHMVSFGLRAQQYAEKDADEESLEGLCRAFDAEHYSPKTVHIAGTLHYLYVAHAHINTCLRSEPSERAKRIPLLQKMRQTVHATARIPLLVAHRLVLDGYLAFFDGNVKRARADFAAASEIAREQQAPWVLYAVARGEAWILRSQGFEAAAVEQAKVAALLAREHGSAHRLRWIREEFSLEVHASSPFSSRSSSFVRTARANRMQRHLRALLQISEATTRELNSEHQARSLLDEVAQALDAERGFLFLSNADGALELRSARSHGADVSSMNISTSVVEDVHKNSHALILDRSDDWRTDAGGSAASTEVHRVLAVPLFLQDRVVGVLYLDRPFTQPSFSTEDADMLQALANQVPIALELAKALRERDRLEDNLRQSQKMEAIGQLAGGIAHDFNNMLTAIDASLGSLRSRIESDPEAAAEVKEIQEAAERAGALTRQLLTFSRRQVVDPKVLDLNGVVQGVVPLLRRVIGDGIEIETDLASDLYPVRVDAVQVEQILLNLAVNARDAMNGSGVLYVRTFNRHVAEEERSSEPRRPAPGDYSVLSVSDTGPGVDTSIRDKIFEPFFTTKPKGTGTGLGLATVYGIVQQAKGSIDVHNRPEGGADFETLLPRSHDPIERIERPAPVPVTPTASTGLETILLVEDERLLRNSLRRNLRRLGYRVLLAEDGQDALQVVETYIGHIDLVVTDVLMPRMTGPELVKILEAKWPDLRVLYISGYTDGHLAHEGMLERGVEFLQKPFSTDEFAARVRSMLAVAHIPAGLSPTEA